jgi:negative regulator of flagellin synthesis FlgM
MGEMVIKKGNNPNIFFEGNDLFNNIMEIRKHQDIEKKDNADRLDESKDKTMLSGKTKKKNELKKLISELPDIRKDKVEALKNAIEIGIYSINPLKVAGKILQEI